MVEEDSPNVISDEVSAGEDEELENLEKELQDDLNLDGGASSHLDFRRMQSENPRVDNLIRGSQVSKINAISSIEEKIELKKEESHKSGKSSSQVKHPTSSNGPVIPN
jgi:hypothetical protein